MVAFLQNETRNGGTVNCTDLQKEFEVDRATVLRDLRFIQDRLEMDVEWDPAAKSYIVNSNSEFLPRRSNNFSVNSVRLAEGY